MNFNLLKTSIKAKLLILVSIALFVCVFGLVFVIIAVQGNFQQEMIKSTSLLLKKSQQSANSGINQLNSDIEKSLLKLAETAGQRLSETTEKKLGKEKDIIALSYQESLQENAKTIAKLIVKVSPSYILSHDYTSLIGLAKAVSENDNIIFAIFKGQNNKLLTRFINKKDPIIKRFIETGKGRKKINKVLDAASKDDNVFLYEQSIELEGQPLGKIILCVSTVEVKKRIAEMSSRFTALVNTNNQMVNTILANESKKVETKLNQAMNLIKQEGEVSTQATTENITKFNKRITKTTRNIIVIGGGICILFVFLVLLFMVTKIIFKPLGQAVEFANQIARGDISREIPVLSNDEIGSLTKALAAMQNNLYKIISEINTGVTTLDSSATGMSAVSTQFTSGLKTSSAKSGTVAAAAEKMSSNSHSVAAAVEQASTNTSSVVININDISKSLDDMANLARHVKEETGSAVTKVKFSSTQVDKLSQASQEIGSITETISSISDKTNLLALNATIEAARAGDSGKGFAVVANEIKELAKQTSDATNNIAQKLELTQEFATITVDEIEDITNAISRIDGSVGAITSAISQQNQTTSAISDNISQTAEGLQEVNENVSQLSMAAGQVAKEITEVNEVNTQMNNSSTQVQQDAEGLKELASQLKGMIQKFRL